MSVNNSFSLFLVTLTLSGCLCSHPEIRSIEPMNPRQDRFLSCKQLKFALSEAQYFHRAATRKKENTEAYAGNPVCLLKTQFAIIKAQESAKDRIDYLNTIMSEKKCAGAAEAPQKSAKDDGNTPLPVTDEL